MFNETNIAGSNNPPETPLKTPEDDRSVGLVPGSKEVAPTAMRYIASPAKKFPAQQPGNQPS